MISRCGVICETDCKAFHVECEGCNELEGRVSWAKYLGKTHCPIYTCAKDQGFDTCADCGKAPCTLWYETRDPEFSDEQFAADIANRLKNLGNLR